MAITFIGTVVAKPETRNELENLLAQQVDPTRAEPGCINYDFHVDTADACVFVFYENWVSQADLDPYVHAASRAVDVPARQVARKTDRDSLSSDAQRPLQHD
jgi:quinol monooxygenase YgiN